MKCKNCGVEFNEGVFCPECGTKNEVVIDELIKENTSQVSVPKDEKQDVKKLEKPDISQKQNTMAIVSLISGILSVITLGCWFIPEIIAIVGGIISKKKGKTKAATGGIVCGIIGSVLLVIVLIIGLFFTSPSKSNSSTTTEVIATTEVTTEKVESKKESKKENDLALYYGKSISELKDNTDIALEGEENYYYSGAISVSTNEKGIITEMGLYVGPMTEDSNYTLEGIGSKDSIDDACKKLEANGYILDVDADSKLYKNDNIVVSLTPITESEFNVVYTNNTDYELKQEESQDDGYYVTDTAYGTKIKTHVYYAYTEHEFGSNIVTVECEITNLSDESITFISRDYYQLDNNGLIINVNGTDYDYKEIAAGYSFKAALAFTCPENSNTDLSLMTMTADNLEFNLGDRPQNEEEKKEFYGTYSRHGGKSRIMVSDNGDGTYDVQTITSIGEDETITNKITNVTLDDNNIFYLNMAAYLWSPDEYTIYSYDPTWEKIDENQPPWVKN